ncbi:presqualene diphosphate synthase HpnD [Actinomadura chibensis]|uniref:Presqualene diphosphate synthase HpnD n=1 Tax=Actinomadura chibensis TaxID=392828 RepID=A0A5D0NUF0_9ACTN|nr:presqualene diphosphate synthase HpnD [Actinomadura chibensis]TYB48017.1 presqualene diphosphate synthase HpnD [Actinomadura chibensis]
MDEASAYRHCENVVRTQARNFSYGIRLLSAPKRRALSAVYAFARRIDDIGDDHDAPPDTRLARLADERARLARIADHPDDPVLVALASAARDHPVPLDAFGELIDGCEADVRGETYDTFDDLLWYCRCVAGAIGRLSLGVFGTSDPDTAVPRADALGVALQLTNILRDIREDRVNGRVYLPAKDLARFGCTLHLDGAGRFTDPPEHLVSLIRYEANRADEWYATGLELLPMLDRRSAACAGAMAGIYRQVLKRITADPLAALETRTSLPTWQKATVSAMAMSGIRR